MNDLDRPAVLLSTLPKLPFRAVHAPGVYLTSRGEIFRLSDGSHVELCRLLRLWGTLAGSEVTQLCADPSASIRDCRALATAAGLPVRF
jgi:hypothetical protein